MKYQSLIALLVISMVCIEYCSAAPVNGANFSLKRLRQRRTLHDKDHSLNCKYEMKEQCIRLGTKQFCRMVLDKTKRICVHGIEK